MRRASKVDRNHAEIKRAFEACGAFVVDASGVGKGFPDLVLAWRGQWLMVEVKDGSKSPSRRVLTDAQEEFHRNASCHGCDVYIVNSVDDAIHLVNHFR